MIQKYKYFNAPVANNLIKTNKEDKRINQNVNGIFVILS